MGNEITKTNSTNINDEYWTGPYGVRVPNSKHSIVGDDGYNTRHKDGGQTEMFMINAPPMNQDIYRQKYAKLGDDGYYYYSK